MMKQLLRTLLVLSVPLIGSAQNVYVTSNYPGGAMFLILPPGHYVLNAKIAVKNSDGDAQYAECTMSSYLTYESAAALGTPPNPPPPMIPNTQQSLDRTDVRTPGGNNYQQSVALQAVYSSPPDANPAGPPRNTAVFVTCHGFAASAAEGVLTAIQVTGKVNTTSGGTGYQAPQL